MKIDLSIGRTFTRLNVDEAVIICHGLPYEPGSAIDKSYDSIAEFFSKRGFPSLVFDFTGTGKSRGEFSLLKWLEDLEIIVENFERFHLVGFSMGGSIAYGIDGAESYSIVSSPFDMGLFTEDSIRGIYSNAILKRTLKGLRDYEIFRRKLLDEFEIICPSSVKAKKNVLVIHGVQDDIVPFSHGVRIFEKSKSPKRFVKIENGDHFLRKNRSTIELIFEWISGKREGESIQVIRI